LTRRTGLLGGTFDPPHMGHLILAESLADRARLDRVLFIPAWHPPHKLGRRITPAVHRRKLVELAISGNDKFELSEWELNRLGPSYTIDTVRHFRDQLRDEQLYWLIGSDSLAELPTWHQFETLVAMVDILTGWRGGSGIEQVLDYLSDKISPRAFEKLRDNIVRTPVIEISSSQVRELVSKGSTIRYLVPDAVSDYILGEGLYRCSK